MFYRLANRRNLAWVTLILVNFTASSVEATESTVGAAKVSFEDVPSGRFDDLNTDVGVWQQTEGEASVDDAHAKTGQHSLRLVGDKQAGVILRIADHVDTTGELTFWAERWTKRGPFSFRVDKDSGDGWKQIYDGDDQIRVGRAFLSQVRIPLNGDRVKQLRFTVTSPPNAGVLIDDLRFARVIPQSIASVEAVPITLPALVGSAASPLLKIRIETVGNLNPISLADAGVSIQCDGNDVESWQLYFGGSSDRFEMARPVGRSFEADNEANRMDLDQPLSEGANYVWIVCRIHPKANIDHKVRAKCSHVTFSNETTIKLDTTSEQRIGIALRSKGDDGVHTFRIPGLVTTNAGTLIGVYDIRRRGGGDLPGDIDVGMSRSTDGGRTWEMMKVIMDMGDDSKWSHDGIGDPAILVDKNTGTIWVAAVWSHGNRSWHGSGPGLSPEQTGQLMLVRSDDDGVTWSDPINITQQVKQPEWSFLLQGPGKGITMRDGTIVFAAQYQDPPNKRDPKLHRLPHSTILYSKDHGTTWQIGSGAFDDTTESQVVEVEPGVLMLNCRYNRAATRMVMTTRDMGSTWQSHPTSNGVLIEPRACMASLINVSQETRGSSEKPDLGNWLLFSNPNSTRGRNHITIKTSPDLGETWPTKHQVLLDEGNCAGYSCLTMIDENTVGILYEGSRAQLTFQRVRIRELIE